jgi:hypothetical protein
VNRENIQTIVQSAQLIVLIIGIGTAMLAIGRRDQQINQNVQDIGELRNISEDLLKTSIASQMSDEFQNEQLRALLRRIEKLES